MQRSTRRKRKIQLMYAAGILILIILISLCFIYICRAAEKRPVQNDMHQSVNIEETSEDDSTEIVESSMIAESSSTQASEEKNSSTQVDRNEKNENTGTQVDEDEKVVYLTFDDGPSKLTKDVLDILKRYDVKATFFVTGYEPECRKYIKEAYEAGHTIGLHTYCHDYETIYTSEEAYFSDLDEVGKMVEEQIGFVPKYIRFPGGASNTVSSKYNQGIMTKLTKDVKEKGYQYYDWNVDSTDGAGADGDQILKQARTDQMKKIMILFHDSATKQETVRVLPQVIEYYKAKGYRFLPVDDNGFDPQHKVQN